MAPSAHVGDDGRLQRSGASVCLRPEQELHEVLHHQGGSDGVHSQTLHQVVERQIFVRLLYSIDLRECLLGRSHPVSVPRESAAVRQRLSGDSNAPCTPAPSLAQPGSQRIGSEVRTEGRLTAMECSSAQSIDTRRHRSGCRSRRDCRALVSGA